MTIFNRDRFKRRQQERKYEQIQHEQKMLFALNELHEYGFSARVVEGQIVIYDSVLEILVCLAYEFFTRTESEYSHGLKDLLQLSQQEEWRIHYTAFMATIGTLWLARPYLRDWDKITRQFDKGEISYETINIKEVLKS